MTEEEYQQELLHEDDRLKAEAERKALEERLQQEKRKALEEEAMRKDQEEKANASRLAAKHLVNKGLPEPQIITEPYEEEEEDMPKPEPINLEITEDQTVVMEINGVEHVLYQGKSPAKKVVVPAKPAKKAEPKPKPKPAPIIEVVPAPAPKPAPSKPLIPRKKNTKRLAPTKKLASFGPGTSDDSMHSIHTLSFEDKIKGANKDIKAKYKGLSDYLVDVYGCSHRVSFGYDAYRVGKQSVVAISLGGVHLRVNAAIDPKTYNGTKMMVNDDSDSKKYEGLPSYIKVISDKSYKQAFRLIDDTMKSLSIKKKKAA